MNARSPWSLVLAILTGALAVLWIAMRLSSILWAAKTLPEVVSDVRGNRLVGLGWLLVVASVPLAFWAWDLRSVALTATAVLFGVAGFVLATYLPYRDEIKRGE